MGTFFSIVVGLVFGMATAVLGLGLAGGGHGWGGPFFLSIPLIVLYPLAFARTFSSKVRSSDFDVGLIAVAILLDIALLGSFSAEYDYIIKMWRFDDGPLFIGLWLGLWVGWQVFAAVALARNRVRRTDAQRS